MIVGQATLLTQSTNEQDTTMRLTLSELPAAYINLDDAVERRASTESVLSELGITKFVRIPGVVVPGSSYWQGLAVAVDNLLDSQQSVPFIMFEDDIVIKLKQDEIELPDDADALFLGISSRGAKAPERIAHLDGLEAVEVPGYPHLRRVLNAVSGHAVAVLSERYVATLRGAVEIAKLPTGFHYDVLASFEHKRLNVYALQTPLVYQDDPKNSFAKGTTNIVLS